MSVWQSPNRSRRNSLVLLVGILRRRRDRRPRRDRAAVLPREHDREGGGHAALHAARARRAATSMSARAATSATSQMIRPLRDEVERYGHYSLAAESMYDHPFQWGSKRTGPDLARVGGKYSDEWHVAHLTDPRAVVPESIMPRYAFLAETRARLARHRRPSARQPHVGVPYTEDDDRQRRAPIWRPRPIPNADTDALLQALPEGRGRAISTAMPSGSPRWMRWSPICRCSARWSTSSSTTTKPICAEGSR